MNLKRIGKVFMCKCVGTGPLSYKKRIHRAAVSKKVEKHWCTVRCGGTMAGSGLSETTFTSSPFKETVTALPFNHSNSK